MMVKPILQKILCQTKLDFSFLMERNWFLLRQFIWCKLVFYFEIFNILDQYKSNLFLFNKERKKGYYSPLTRSGTILVDDVLCSCYASAPPYQALFNLALAPLRIYTKIFPSKHLDKEIHPYVKFLNRGRWIVEFLDYLNVSQIFS